MDRSNTEGESSRCITGPWRLLTVAQAAAELGMTEWAVRTAIWEGALPAVRIGRAVRVRREDLELWRGGCAGRGSVM
jgi:excisionase family DNA binding protein